MRVFPKIAEDHEWRTDAKQLNFFVNKKLRDAQRMKVL